jgi:hypothetical protein
LAGAAFSIVMIYLITWISDKLRENERVQALRYRKEVKVPPTGAMDTEQMLNVLRQIRKDRAPSTAKEGNETNQNEIDEDSNEPERE